MTRFLLYAGSFDEVFNICSFDTETERLTHLGSVSQPRPAHMALSRDNRTLYVASEMMGEPGGVCAYDLSDPAHPLRISDVRPGTQGPCYIMLTEDEHYLIGCSYFEGDVEVFPVQAGGSLGERCFEARLSVPTDRARAGGGASAQAVPRAHGAAQIRGTDLILVSDFSNDRVICSRLGADGSLADVSGLSYTRGEEVRHFALHPTRDDLVYMLTQSANLFVIRVDRATGALADLGGIHTLPAGRAGMSSAVKCSPDGRHIYATNRQNRDIGVLSVEEDPARPVWAGVLENAGFVRDLTFSPDGRHLLVGDQQANTITVYRVPEGNGLPERLASKFLAESPTCITFLGPG
ncbi:MAG: lactonase family protein [Anaerolineae bacterium]